MITQEEFEKAKFLVKYNQDIVEEYYKQQREEFARRQKEREDACPEHEYRSDASKWTPVNRMSCINCGKKIE